MNHNAIPILFPCRAINNWCQFEFCQICYNFNLFFNIILFFFICSIFSSILFSLHAIWVMLFEFIAVCSLHCEVNSVDSTLRITHCEKRAPVARDAAIFFLLFRSVRDSTIL